MAQAGYAFTVEAADVDESLLAGEAADDYVRRLAEEKATAVFGRHVDIADPTHDDEAVMSGAPKFVSGPPASHLLSSSMPAKLLSDIAKTLLHGDGQGRLAETVGRVCVGGTVFKEPLGHG